MHERRRELGTRLTFATITTVIALAIMSALIWGFTPSPRQDNEMARTPKIATDLGSIAGQSDAELAGWNPLTPAQAGDPSATWAASTHILQMPDRPSTGIVSTAHGTIAVFASPRALATPNEYGKETDYSPETGASLVSLDPQTGAVRWYRRIRPAVDMLNSSYSTGLLGTTTVAPEDLAGESLSVSPDGERIALRLMRQSEVAPSTEDSYRLPEPGESQTIVVLSSSTGEVVRTVEVSDIILGQGLTDDALLVQTSTTRHPEGGSISSYSLTDADADPVSWPSTGWFAGIASEGVMQSSSRLREPCRPAACALATVTLSDPATGAIVSSYDRVTVIHPTGGIERFSDGQAPPVQDDSTSWLAARRELVDLSSGSVTDITGLTVDTMATPSGKAWVAGTPSVNSSSGELSTGMSTKVGWLPVGDPAQASGGISPLRTEPLDSITASGMGNGASQTVVKRSTTVMSAHS